TNDPLYDAVNFQTSPFALKLHAKLISSGGPTVTLTTPADNSGFVAGSTIPLAASVTGNAVTAMAFEVTSTAGHLSLGPVTSTPYSFNWTAVPAGTYTIR